ncbi:MAG: outer membrane protein [Candidatus Angelobacter sp.]
MNRFLAGTCVLVLGFLASGSAQAQDDFRGFYVGATAGGNFGRARLDTVPIFSAAGYFNPTSTPAIATASNQDVDPKRYTFGGQAGYNFQWDNVILGLEADFSRTDLSGTATATQTYPCCAPTAFTVNQSIESKWLFTARPRVGLVFGHVMIYGTAGFAVAHVKYDGLFTDTFATAHETASIDQTNPGWAVGGGAEMRISHHWSIKGEYLLADVTGSAQSQNLTAFTPPIAFPSNVFTHTVDLMPKLARGGVNFRF